MKKTLLYALLFSSLLLLLVPCLTSCTSNPEEDLLGTWISRLEDGDDLYASITYSFYKVGDTYSGRMSGGYYGSSASYDFTFTIENDKLVFTLDNGNTIEHDYTMNNQVLTLDGMEFVKE